MKLLPGSRPALLTAALLAGSVTASEWSTIFDLPGLHGRVFALGDWNGRVVAGGQTFQADGHTFGHLATFDGLRWQPLGLGVTGDVRDMVTFEGDLVVGGWFHVAGGTVPQGGVIANGVARWDGSGWSSLGDGLDLSWSLDPEVWALAVWRGELYAGGQFDNTGGQPLSGLAKWTGSQWVPVGGGVGGVTYPTVHELYVDAQDRLIVGGNFQSVGGQPAGGIAAWDGSSWERLDGGSIQNFVTVFELDEFQGDLYAAGSFGTLGTPGTKDVARWDGSAWQPLQNGLPDWDIGVTGYALEVFEDRLYVGGNFHGIDGLPASRIAAWDGSQWESVGGVSGQDLATTVLALHTFGGELWVGGEFTRAGLPATAGPDAVVSADIARWDGMQWSQASHGLGIDREVYDLVAWNGGVVAVGRFIEAGGAQATRVAFFDGSDWSGLGATDGNVQEAIVWEGKLVVTGDFSSVDGVATGPLAVHDGTGWSALGNGAGGAALGIYEGQLYAGGLGGAMRWNGTSWESFGQQTFGIVECMQVYDGVLYMGGSFGGFFSGLSRNVVGWDGQSMVNLGDGADGIVEQLTVHDGQLLAGGRFFEVDGIPARIMATWDGSQWAPFDGGQTGFSVEAFAELDGVLYAGGDLFYGTQDPADYVGRWNGSAWEPLGDGLGGYVFTLLADEANGHLWAGGWFYDAEGGPSWNLARWELQPAAGGEAWEDLSRGLRGGDGLVALAGWGALQPGSPFGLDLSGVPAFAPTFSVLGLEPLVAPFRGGVLVPSPDLVVGLAADAAGELHLNGSWPAGVPAGTHAFWQTWASDPGAPAGLSGSNALRSTAP